VATRPNSEPRPPRRGWLLRIVTEQEGQGVVGYAAVAAIFVIVLIVVLATLGDSIGQALQGLVDQLPLGVDRLGV
jgi:hypothetical protein